MSCTSCHEITLPVLTMKKQILMFAIFLPCSALAVGKTFPIVGSRHFKRRQAAGRLRTFENEARIKRPLHLNKKDVAGSSSRNRYARDVFSDQDSRSLNSQTSHQHRKLKDLNKEVGLSGAIRTKRSADHPQKDEPAFLLYIVGNAIKKLTLDNNVESTLVQLNGSPPLYMDFHYKENRLYWADSNSIHSSFLNNGTGIQTIHKHLPSIKGLAIDWFGNNIYWLVQGYIMVSRTDGRYLKTLKTDFITDNLVLDPERGYMYWFSTVGDPSDENNIIRASMYGENKGQILHDLPVHTHFAIDYYDRKIYWTATTEYDADYPSEIRSYRLDTEDIQDDKSKKIVAGLSRLESLAVSEEYVYWINEEENSIHRANKTVGYFLNVKTIIKDKVGVGKEKARSLKFVHCDIQKDFVGNDACSTRKYCSHFCFPDPSDHLFRCECPDNTTAIGTRYWNRTCVCPSGQYMDPKGDCTYLDAPWNVVATPLNSTSIQLTWFPPKVSRSHQVMYYIFRGIDPSGVDRWPFARTSSTTFVIGHLKRYITYVFAVSHGIQGHRSLAADIKLKYELIPPSTRPQSTSSKATMSHAPTTTQKSSTTQPQSSVTSLPSTSSQGLPTNPRTPQSTVTDTSTKRPLTSLMKSSSNSQSISSSAAARSPSKPPQSSGVSSYSTSSREVTTNPSRSTSSGSSQSTAASPSNPLPLHQDKSFPYWTIGLAAGGLLVLIAVALLIRKYKRRTQGEGTDASTFLPLRDPPEEEDYDDEETDSSRNEMFLPQLEFSNE